MPSKTTFEITRIWDMLCRQGPSERYAPLGLSFPPLPRRAPPIHEATGGYAAPTASAAGDWENCNDANDVEIKNPEEVETVVETTIPVDSDTETGNKLIDDAFLFRPSWQTTI